MKYIGLDLPWPDRENSKALYLQRLPISSMSRLIAIITVLHVLAHSVFGCCSHNDAHTSSMPHCCHSTNDIACSHHSAHGQQLEQHELGPQDFLLLATDLPAQPHHVCLHSSCQWLNSKSLSPADVLRWDFNNAVAVVPIAVEDFVHPTAATAPCDRSDLANSALPLRLHLMLGVLQV